MRLYLDNEYNPDFRDLIKALHVMDGKSEYEIVDGRWQDSYEAEDTIVFITDDSALNLNEATRGYYNDGYTVFAWRKPFGKGLDVFQQSLIVLSQWRNILSKLGNEKRPFVYVISEAKSPLRRALPTKERRNANS